MNKNMLTIRLATTNDVPLIHELAWKIFPETYKNILSTEQKDFMMEWMYSIQNLIKQMTEENHTYLLGYENNICIGYVSVQPQNGTTYHLQKLYVLPEKQGHGYGKQLFMAAVEFVKSTNSEIKSIQLNVNRYNSAQSFYKHLGMKIIAEGDFDIGHGYYMNDYIMEYEL